MKIQVNIKIDFKTGLRIKKVLLTCLYPMRISSRTCFIAALGLQCFFCNFIFSQSKQELDSMITLLKRAKEDTSRVSLMNKISSFHFQLGEYDEAMQQAAEAKKLAESKLPSQKEVTAVYNSLQKGLADAC